MSTGTRNDIKREVLKYVAGCDTPVSVSAIAEQLRSQPGLETVRDSEFLAVVQPMIVTGKLSYAPGLKITRGKP